LHQSWVVRATLKCVWATQASPPHTTLPPPLRVRRMSYHTYPCESTTAPTRKREFFLLNLTPLGRNELRPYICSSLSVYFGMAHGKVGAASYSKQKIQIFTRCLYRGGSRLCAVYVLSATLSPEARSTVHSS